MRVTSLQRVDEHDFPAELQSSASTASLRGSNCNPSPLWWGLLPAEEARGANKAPGPDGVLLHALKCVQADSVMCSISFSLYISYSPRPLWETSGLSFYFKDYSALVGYILEGNHLTYQQEVDGFVKKG